MRILLARKLPSSVARVAQLSCASAVWIFTKSNNEQDAWAFPPGIRFSVARLHKIQYGLDTAGLLPIGYYPAGPSLNRACSFHCTRLKAVLSRGWQPNDWALADPTNTRLGDGTGRVGAPFFDLFRSWKKGTPSLMMRRQKLPHVFRYVVQKIRLFIFTYYLHLRNSFVHLIFHNVYCVQLVIELFCQPIASYTRFVKIRMRYKNAI